MSFDYAEYLAFVQFLYKHPELRAEVRKVVLSEDILTLPQVVRELSVSVKELAEAQKRSEERLTRLETVVAELAEAQKRTEQRVEELAAAQKRSDERLTAVENRLTRVEDRVERLETKVDRLAEELGGLKATIGSSLEDEAASMLEYVMRQKGYRLLSEAEVVRFNGEVDAALRAESPEGQRVSAVMESKARLGAKDVTRWAQRMRSSDFQHKLAAAGYPPPYLVYTYGIRVDSAARQAAQEAGVGVIKGDGEIFPPREAIGSEQAD